MVKKICLTCKKEFRAWPYEVRKGKARYCSRACVYKAFKGEHHSLTTEFKKGQKSYWKGRKRPEIKKWLTPFCKNRTPWNKGLEGYMAREKHWNWQGGITPLRKKLHLSHAYRIWRKKVLERDNYTCQVCGKKQKKGMHIDHIMRWKEYPNLRTDINNGRVLCFSCHIKSETYGRRIYNGR